MTAPRLRDILATAIGRHPDIDAVEFPKHHMYGDRLSLNVRDTQGVTWRVQVLRDSWSRPSGDEL